MMNRNMTSLARDRRTARPVFRSFLDGIVLLAFTALLLTVQVTPVDELANRSAGADLQPIQASVFPSIQAAHDPATIARPEADPQPATACSKAEKEVETLVFVIRRGEGSSAQIFPAVVRPEV